MPLLLNQAFYGSQQQNASRTAEKEGNLDADIAATLIVQQPIICQPEALDAPVEPWPRMLTRSLQIASIFPEHMCITCNLHAFTLLADMPDIKGPTETFVDQCIFPADYYRPYNIAAASETCVNVLAL